MKEQTDLFGIAVPSTDPAFLCFVVLHIAMSLVAVISGLLAMLAAKTSVRHRRNGRIYFWSVSVSFGTTVILSLMRWPQNVHLLTIGIVTFFLAFLGRQLATLKQKDRMRMHTVCMGLSYVLLLTGFYVDNGKNLPFWRTFPVWFFYLFPSLVGIPIILKALLTHPLNRRRGPGD